MAYRKFTLKKVVKEFNLSLREERGLFADAPELQSTKLLQEILPEYKALALASNTDKARSELLISPIIMDVRRQLKNSISVFSGIKFDVDKDRGLTGSCDFIISQSPFQQFVCRPVLAIAEAKKGNPLNGFGQCVAEMVAAQIFNEREGNSVNVIYGVSTTGTAWRFLKLEGNQVILDKSDYYISELEKIIGILTYIVSYEV